MSKKAKIVSVLLMCVLLLGGIIAWIVSQNKIELVAQEQVIIEYGEIVDYNPTTFLDLEEISEKGIEKLLDEAKVSLVDNQAITEVLPVGDYIVEITYKDQKVDSLLTVQDTIAPIFEECAAIEVELGTETLDLSGKIVAQDLQEVTYEFDLSAVKLNEIGNYEATVIASDASLNKAEEKIEVVVKDTTAPVFDEMKTIEIEYGNKEFDFSSAVKAKDLQTIKYTYHTEDVNFKKAGTYKMKVEAVDASGNIAEIVCNVKVKEEKKQVVSNTNTNTNANTPNKQPEKDVYKSTGNQELDALCDKVLDEIVNAGMSDRQKLKAVYNWVEKNIKYRGSTPIGDWRSGAIKALSTRKGNCVGFCYTSEALLTRLGFSNIEICQTDKGHFWNMVKYNGSWYHFDTTTGWGTQRFLWTTAQIKEYENVAKDLRYGEFDESAYPKTP